MRKIGHYILFLGALFRRPVSFRTYVKLTFDECVYVGWNSVLLVTITSLFIGAVTTIQTAYNLVSPFIPKSVIGLVVRETTISELAPTITALVLAGKIGSSIAGNLGTMKITEQIDALEVMGINSISYLVLPKILACLIMFPLLVIIAAFLGITGGYLAAEFTSVVSTVDFVQGITTQFNSFIIVFALIKSVVFAFAISSISAYMGYYTKGGALEVGQASTKAVTISCIAILLSDFILAKLLLN